MASSLTAINTSTDQFETLITRLNAALALISNEVVTANSTTGSTTGNAELIGSFQANTIAVPSGIRGGTLSTPAVLTLESNVASNSSFNISIGSATVNAVINSTSLTISNSTVSISLTKPTAAQISDGGYYYNANGNWSQVTLAASGANTQVTFNDSGSSNATAGFVFDKTTNTISVGNSTVYTVITPIAVSSDKFIANQTGVYVGSNVTISLSDLKVGNSTVNSVTNSAGFFLNTTQVVDGSILVGNSTVNVSVNSTSVSLANSTAALTLTKPTAAEISDGTYVLNANGSYVAANTLTTNNSVLWDASAKTVSTGDPSGGNDGDIWLKYTV